MRCICELLGYEQKESGRWEVLGLSSALCALTWAHKRTDTPGVSDTAMLVVTRATVPAWWLLAELQSSWWPCPSFHGLTDTPRAGSQSPSWAFSHWHLASPPWLPWTNQQNLQLQGLPHLQLCWHTELHWGQKLLWPRDEKLIPALFCHIDPMLSRENSPCRGLRQIPCCLHTAPGCSGAPSTTPRVTQQQQHQNWDKPSQLSRFCECNCIYSTHPETDSEHWRQFQREHLGCSWHTEGSKRSWNAGTAAPAVWDTHRMNWNHGPAPELQHPWCWWDWVGWSPLLECWDGGCREGRGFMMQPLQSAMMVESLWMRIRAWKTKEVLQWVTPERAICRLKNYHTLGWIFSLLSPAAVTTAAWGTSVFQCIYSA